MRQENNDSTKVAQQEPKCAQQQADDREVLFGFLALLSLALPALAIRTLLPDLNPLVLAGVGLATYGAYLGWLFRTYSAQSTEEQVVMETARVSAGHDQSLRTERKSE